MREESTDLDIANIVSVDGFHFSGSSIINDIFEQSGYKVPRNIRTDEFLYIHNNFSWPRALNEEYTFKARIFLAIRLLKIIITRIPLNFLQKTPIYDKYLFMKGREERMHQSTSVNRSLWSYLVSLYITIFWYSFSKELFVKWFKLKYRWQIFSHKNLLLDNGIPRDKRLADWFFGMHGSIGIFVYRNPRIQFQQIDHVYRLTGKITPNYDDFLNELKSQYDSINWFLSSEHNVLFISFDKFLADINYREKLADYFKKKRIINEMKYDFSKSVRNNESLSDLLENKTIKEGSTDKEKAIENYHNLFEDKLYRMIGD